VLDTDGDDHGRDFGKHWDALCSPPGCLPDVVNRPLDMAVNKRISQLEHLGSATSINQSVAQVLYTTHFSSISPGELM